MLPAFAPRPRPVLGVLTAASVVIGNPAATGLAQAPGTAGRGTSAGAATAAAPAETIRELGERHLLLGVATAWRQARTIAGGGTLPGGTNRESGATYDLVALAATGEGARAPFWSFAKNREYTREAFGRAWSRVAPGGALAWLASDEALFGRGVLQVAEALAAAGDGAAFPLADRAFALRTPEAATTPYKFLLLVPRERFSPEDAMRLAALESALPLRVLFGPGFPPRGAWGEAASAKEAKTARDLLRRDLSRRAGRWLDLSGTTTNHPVFLDPETVAPASLRAVAGVALFTMLALLAFPRTARRRLDSPLATRWPLPLLMAPLVTAVAAPLFALFALAGRSVVLQGRTLLDPAAALVGAGLGVTVALARAPRGAGPAAPTIARLSGRVGGTGLAVAGAALALLLNFALDPLAESLFASVLPRALLVGLAGALFGFAGGGGARTAWAALAAELPDVAPWAFRAAIAGAVAAAALAPWLVDWKGFPAAWIAAAVAYLVAGFAGLALLPPPARAGPSG